MNRRLLAAALAVGITLTGAFSASAAVLCSKYPGKEAIRQYKQETAPLLEALQAKNVALSEANTFGISESLATQTPDIAKIDAIENDIKVLEGKIGAAKTRYGIAVCCRI